MTIEKVGGGRDLAARLATFARKWAGSLAISSAVLVVLLILAFFRILDLSASFLLAGMAIAAGIALALVRSRSGSRKYAVSIFAIALFLRLLSSLSFQIAGAPYGDQFGGSPDGWKYHVWARQAGELILDGEPAHLSRYDRVGSWAVGFYYVLGTAYIVTGPDPAVGRLLVCLFGALAVLVFHRLAREILDFDRADLSAFLLAVWPNTILWNGYSILRDSLVWLLLATAIFMGVRALRGSWWGAAGLLAVGVGLRFVRAYAWFLTAGGFAAAIAAGLVFAAYRKRAREFLPRAAAIGIVVVTVEVIVMMIGFPGPIDRLEGYAPGRFLLKAIPRHQLPPEFIARAGLPEAHDSVDRAIPPSQASSQVDAPGQESLSEGETSTARESQVIAKPMPVPMEPPALVEPSEALHPMLRFAGNAVRFLLGPFAWTFDVPSPNSWLLPSMWLWYAALPAIGIGFVLAWREPYPVAVLLTVVLLFSIVMVSMGRGDAFRQREMLTPVYLLAAVITLSHFEQRRRLIVASYILFVVLLGAGILYHRHSMRERGLIGDVADREPRPAVTAMIDGGISDRAGLPRTGS